MFRKHLNKFYRKTCLIIAGTSIVTAIYVIINGGRTSGENYLFDYFLNYVYIIICIGIIGLCIWWRDEDKNE